MKVRGQGVKIFNFFSLDSLHLQPSEYLRISLMGNSSRRRHTPHRETRAPVLMASRQKFCNFFFHLRLYFFFSHFNGGGGGALLWFYRYTYIFAFYGAVLAARREMSIKNNVTAFPCIPTRESERASMECV
jgi:hypothetical protein